MAIRDNTLTCPHCGHAERETMPLDRCVFFWECPSCHTLLKPRKGDCCVYCSFGEVKCPPVQDDRPCPDAA